MPAERLWERFSYQSALTAVVVGLAITHLLGCVAGIVNERPRVRAYWLHVAWLVLAFAIIAQFWFASFFWAHDAEAVGRSFPEFLAFLSVPVALYLSTSMLAPQVPPAPEPFDFRTYYYARHRSIFLMFAITLVALGVHRTLVSGQVWLRTTNVIRATGVVCLVALAIWRNRLLHELMMGALVTLFVVFTLFF